MQPSDYRPQDERSWLECRVLAFLNTAYFDDVATAKPDTDAAVQLVVRDGERVVAVLDASVEDKSATVETVAVLPAYQGRGIASALLEEAVRRVRVDGVTELEAWTRDDLPTLRWYAARGFGESDHYLHVYADSYVGDLTPAAAQAFRDETGLRPVKVFAHATIDQEAALRAAYRRVHVCRRMALPLG